MRRASASTARTHRRRSATASPTAASAWRFPRRSGSSSTSSPGRRSSFSRQLDAEVGQDHDRAEQRDEPADDPAWMTRLAHGRGEGTAEQDEDAADETNADDRGGQPEHQMLPAGRGEKVHYDWDRA